MKNIVFILFSIHALHAMDYQNLNSSKNALNQTDKKDKEALILAIKKEDIEAVQCLLSQDADINAANHLGELPLIAAVDRWNKNGSTIARLLLKNGASVNMKDYRGNTAFHCALDSKQHELIDLMYFRANKDVTDSEGITGTQKYVRYQNSKYILASIARKAKLANNNNDMKSQGRCYPPQGCPDRSN